MSPEKVIIPHQPEMRKAILAGRKTATSRTKQYGSPGDYFMLKGRVFIILEVLRLPLDIVMQDYYLQEGFESPLDFMEIWKKLHPKANHRPKQKVYVHIYKSEKDLAQFHVHQFDTTRCTICGYRKESNELET